VGAWRLWARALDSGPQAPERARRRVAMRQTAVERTATRASLWHRHCAYAMRRPGRLVDDGMGPRWFMFSEAVMDTASAEKMAGAMTTCPRSVRAVATRQPHGARCRRTSASAHRLSPSVRMCVCECLCVRASCS
jgi:hypothetical protein